MFWLRKKGKRNDAFISLGAGFYQIPLIREIKDLGLKVICVDSNSNASGMESADLKIQESIYDSRAIELKINELFFDGRIRGALARSYGDAVKTSVKLSSKFGVKLFPYEMADEIYNKKKMKNAFNEMKIPSAAFISFRKDSKIFDYPYVLKPASGHAKTGCRLISSDSDLNQYMKNCDLTDEIIAEKYIEGDEIVAVGIVDKGKFYLVEITDKVKTEAPYFVDIKHIAPSKYLHRWSEIESYGQKIADYYSMERSPLVMEFIFTPKEEIFIIEVAPEFGGEFICDNLIPVRSSYNVFRNAVASCLGRSFVKPDPKKNKNAVCVNYITSTGGILNSFKLPELKNPEIKAFYMFKNTGDEIKSPKTNHDRIGVVVTTGKSREEAVENAETVIKDMEINVRSKKK